MASSELELAGHVEVEHQHRGLVTEDRAQRRVGVAGLRDDLEAAGALEHHPQSGAHDGVVVGEDDRDRLVGGGHGGTISYARLRR